ncbi:competence/damage-inducible protein A [Ornithinibacillus sp. BX22]|uniref:Putative competence-damage inducible protein n=2 Tax=Ornithinibacillus TaxID=484508 RepID=A0A923RGH8_9BACI|nr:MULTISPECIES: competence/damage-inducible protein A [Ornithinibacillus]MBC5636034.1 competence/damage-inducible protein A [Ornithinibacillus hominis]MBS3679977.1 competence/damage-inducible protein A [Ornithinibacillus massiliensis]
MKQIKTEIIAVGTELLLGQIANTNAQWISEQLALQGINVYYHGVVGDNLTRVKDTFALANDRSDVVIVTGGLGPTDDDLTREAFQLMSGLTMVEHPASMEKIEAVFAKQNSQMTPNNRKQARVFKDSLVFHNPVGMAPGMLVHYNDTIWIFLPGVPREMKAIMVDEVLPILRKELNLTEIIKSYVLRFIGIGESKLEHELKELMEQQQNPTIAPLAQSNGIVLRLTAKAASEDEAIVMLEETKANVLAKVHPFYVGMNDETIEQSIINNLKELKLTLASAESLTGGKFIEKIISVPGASEVCKGSIVCYDESVKRDVLGVSEEILTSYGTVSRECALEMSKNVAQKLHSSIGISFTGIAGPDAVEGKPVGTVYVSVFVQDKVHLVEKFELIGDRASIRHRAVMKGFELLFNLLKQNLFD